MLPNTNQPVKSAKVPGETYLEKFFPQLKSERAQNYATMVLTLLAVSLFGIFAISPTVSTIVNLNKQIADDQTVYQALQQKSINLASLDQTYNQLGSDLDYVNQAVPENPLATQLLGKIQAAATQNNVKLTSIQAANIAIPSLAASPVLPDSYDLNISAEGNISDLQNFLSTLISLDRIITITSIDISNTQTKDAATTLSVQAQTYYKKI